MDAELPGRLDNQENAHDNEIQKKLNEVERDTEIVEKPGMLGLFTCLVKMRW